MGEMKREPQWTESLAVGSEGFIERMQPMIRGGKRLQSSPSKVRHSHTAAADFLDTVERSEALRLEWIGPERFQAAARLFRGHPDKGWPSTDCVSFMIMRELRTRDAFTTEHHLRKAGSVPLLKS
jgi:predicted nucleic acid-binding protein